MSAIRKAFVMGYPIAHSRSPVIHNYWLKHYNLEGSYERIGVAPEDFTNFIAGLKDNGFVGGNVTMPHKDAAFAAAEVTTERARLLRAVNTLWFENGVLHGDNTDIIGFTGCIEQILGKNWHHGVETALVIGAGGAARAVVMGLLGYPGLKVRIVNRTSDKADDMTIFDRERIATASWDDLADEVAGAGLIVNTTSLGMTGYPPLLLDFARSCPDTIVADIVYVPLMTPLLTAAEDHGLRIVDGLGMLLHQAVPGFARWFGVTPEVTPELREAVLRDLKERG